MTAVERGVVGLADDATGGVEDLGDLGEAQEVLVVLEGAVASDLALADEGWPVDRTEGHVVAPDVDGVLGVAGLHVELLGRLGHLRKDELRVEEDGVLLHALPRLSEEVEGAIAHELHADLGDETTPRLVDLVHGVRREDLVAGHRVDEHGPSGGIDE